MHTSTRMLVCGWAERCHMVPSPLAGEGQGGGYNTHCFCFVSVAQQMRASCWSRVFLHRTNFALGCVVATPLPFPPPQGGREPCGTHLRISCNVPAALPKMCACLLPWWERAHQQVLRFSATR